MVLVLIICSAGVIEELIKKHRQIDAVQFIQAFGLSEAFPPAPLLKAYVDEIKGSLNNKGDAGATPSVVCSFYLLFDTLMIFQHMLVISSAGFINSTLLALGIHC